MKLTYFSLIIAISSPSLYGKVPHLAPLAIHYNQQKQTAAPFSLNALIAQCAHLPEKGYFLSKSLVSQQEFMATIARYTGTQKELLFNADWHNGLNPFQQPNAGAEFKPFAQKIALPAGSSVALFGDLHGNIHALTRLLKALKDKDLINDNLTISNPHFYMAFLGDYVDRGNYGVEVIHTLLMLKQANPDHVFLVRGNHEDAAINIQFGFTQELTEKFPALSRQEKAMVHALYNLLPTALYIGIGNETAMDYAMCCHGGLELGYNPNKFLHESSAHYDAISMLDRAKEFQILPKNLKLEISAVVPAEEISNAEPIYPTDPFNFGHLWTDFSCDGATRFAEGRGWLYGKALTERVMQNHKICTIIRAHQHYGAMLNELQKQNGLVNLWHGMVYTLGLYNTALLPRDSYAIMHIGTTYKESSIAHIIL